MLANKKQNSPTYKLKLQKRQTKMLKLNKCTYDWLKKQKTIITHVHHNHDFAKKIFRINYKKNVVMSSKKVFSK